MSWSPNSPVAFIGTRTFETLPNNLRQLFCDAARYAATNGVTVVTGAAVGADQAAAHAALEAGGHVRLVLPWPRYEAAWVNDVHLAHPGRTELVVYRPELHEEWTRSVFTYHAAANKLSRGALMLHARNYGIIAGAQVVITVPRSLTRFGGTGQGIRIAHGLKTPVYPRAQNPRVQPVAAA